MKGGMDWEGEKNFRLHHVITKCCAGHDEVGAEE